MPAIAAVIRQANVAAIRHLKLSFVNSLVRSGIKADIPPTNMAMDARCVKPQSAYEVMMMVRGEEMIPLFIARARSLYATTSVNTIFSPMICEAAPTSCTGIPRIKVSG